MKDKGFSPAAISALAKGDIDNFIAAATPGGIERQEAQGQQDFVNSERLPRDMHGNSRAVLEKAGVIFGNSGDDLFVDVKLPAGWSKQATDHSMWSNLLDDKGRKRASIFYKAAFYDRSAHLGLDTRFSVVRDYDRDDGKIVFHVKDGDSVIWSTSPVAEPNAAQWQFRESEREKATAWLVEKYPNYNDPSAYWE